MNQGLEIKRVPFLGTELMAARDADGQIWAGVRWMCNGIGLSQGQTNREINKISVDVVLKEGYTKFGMGVFDPNNPTIALKLDFIPLWLAKISITPVMKAEHPELAETLKQYQLKAKDVLAAAFLPTKPVVTAPAIEQRVLTTDDYLRAASIIANCRNERLPYVLHLLGQGGFDLPKVNETYTSAQAVADAINSAVEVYGYTLDQLAEMTGIDNTNLCRYRKGHRKPSQARAELIIRVISDATAQMN